MRHVYVRPLRLYDEQDKAAFIAAADASGKEFPKDVFTLPSTRIMVAETVPGEILVYQPHFISLTLGSLIHGIVPRGMLAEAQHQLTVAAFTRAHTEGLADVLAFSTSPETRRFALRHGFDICEDGLRMRLR